MSLGIHLSFDGNCMQALRFYSEVFRKPMPPVIKYKDSPQDRGRYMTNIDKELVMYADLTINGSKIMFGDVPSWMPLDVKVGRNMAIYLRYNDENEITRLFHELLNGGRLIMELAPTSWNKSYGYVIDKYGVSWMLGYEKKK